MLRRLFQAGSLARNFKGAGGFSARMELPEGSFTGGVFYVIGGGGIFHEGESDLPVLFGKPLETK